MANMGVAIAVHGNRVHLGVITSPLEMLQFVIEFKKLGIPKVCAGSIPIPLNSHNPSRREML